MKKQTIQPNTDIRLSFEKEIVAKADAQIIDNLYTAKMLRAGSETTTSTDTTNTTTLLNVI